MADAHVTQNLQDLTAKLDRLEQAYQQIAVSVQQYQAQLTELRQQLSTVARDTGHAAAPPPPQTGAASRAATQGVTPPVPSAEAEAARVASAQSAGMPVNVPPLEGMAQQEQEAEAKAGDKDKAPAAAPAAGSPPARGTRPGEAPPLRQPPPSPGRGSRSASDKDKDKDKD